MDENFKTMKLTWSDKFYIGETINDLPDGVGEMTYLFNNSDNSYYGEWVKGCRHGFGIFKIGNNLIFGFWRNDMMNGVSLTIKDKDSCNESLQYCIYKDNEITLTTEDKEVIDDFIKKYPFSKKELKEESLKRRVQNVRV